jgi:hypothetical protein
MIITPEMKINIAVCTISIFFILGCNKVILSSAALFNDSSKEEDKFGIEEIYPTKPRWKRMVSKLR